MSHVVAGWRHFLRLQRRNGALILDIGGFPRCFFLKKIQWPLTTPFFVFIATVFAGHPAALLQAQQLRVVCSSAEHVRWGSDVDNAC